MMGGGVEAQAAEPAPAPVYAPAPVAVPVAAPVAKTEKSGADFDKIRANFYGEGVNANPAAAFTVRDQMMIPHLWKDAKFVYVEPVNKSGVAVFPLFGGTGIIGVKNGEGDNGITTMGMTFGTMAVTLDVGANYSKTSSKPKGGAESTNSYYGKGQHVGVNFSMDMGSNALWVNASNTAEYDMKDSKTETQTFATRSISAGFSNFPSGAETIWNAGAKFERLELKREVDVGNKTTTSIDLNAHSTLGVNGSVGKVFAKSVNARAIIGGMAGLEYKLFDELESTVKDHSSISLELSPNLSGEYAFTPRWYVFGGAVHSLFISRKSTTIGTLEASEIPVYTQETSANAGMRYQHGVFAAEAGIESSVFEDGPSRLFDKGDLLVDFAAMLQF
jgi:hypothetical protein